MPRLLYKTLPARSLQCYNSTVMSTAEIIAELSRLSSAELAQVQAKVKELVEPVRTGAPAGPIAAHPALGIWKNRTDLPTEAVEASKLLRKRMIQVMPGDVIQ